MGGVGAVFGRQFLRRSWIGTLRLSEDLTFRESGPSGVAPNVLKGPFSFLLQLILNLLYCWRMARTSRRLRGGGTGVGQALSGKLVRRFRIREVELGDSRIPIRSRYRMRPLLWGIEWTKQRVIGEA